MSDKEKDRIKCAIRHIKSSVDVDTWAMEIAVNAMLKELKNSNGTDINVGSMDDTISRQALIEHLRRTIEASSNDGDYNEGFNDGMDFAASFAKTLPSAQPELGENSPSEQPKTNELGVKTGATCTDTISRQAAMDAFASLVPYAIDDALTEAYAHGLSDGYSVICNLLSAQPEITDIQAIEQLQASGWMQSHDKQMYEAGLKEHLSDDGDSYDALLPSAQPERRTGKWKLQTIKGKPLTYCSECGFGKHVDEMRRYSYCPNCGADMRGGEDE